RPRETTLFPYTTLFRSDPARRAQRDLTIEAAGTAQRGIEHLWEVGRADHDHLAPGDQSVHRREQLGDDPLLDLAGHLRALGRDRDRKSTRLNSSHLVIS